jgi:hypothetical protein
MSIDDELDGISIGYVANCLRENFCVSQRTTSNERSGIFCVSDMVLSHGSTSLAALSRNNTSNRPVVGS